MGEAKRRGTFGERAASAVAKHAAAFVDQRRQQARDHDKGAWNLECLVPAEQGWMSDAECAALVGFGVLLESDRMLAGEEEPVLEALEVGCYKGRATSALAHAFDIVTVIDTFEGPAERPDEADVRRAFDENMAKRPPGGAYVSVFEGRSEERLAELGKAGRRYDLVLVDGDHGAKAVELDLRLAWPLVRDRGYLFVDDVNWPTVGQGIMAWYERARTDMDRVDLTMHLVSKKLAFVRKLHGRAF